MESLNPLDNTIYPMEGLFNRLFSAATAAPRFVNSVIKGDVKNFEVFEDQSVGDSLKEKFGGELAVGTLVLGSQGVKLDTKPKTHTTPTTTQPRPFTPGGDTSQTDWNSLLASQSNTQQAGISPVMIGFGILLVVVAVIYKKELAEEND